MRGSKKGNLNVRSGLSLNSGQQIKKNIQFGSQIYTARHVVVSAQNVRDTTIVHSLNIRSQESLTLDSVRDIYPDVVAEGVKQEGVAYLNPETKLYELFDGSRRRFCAIEANKDLPLWVLEQSPNPKEIKAYVELTQKVKMFSWREQGRSYLKFALEHNINKDDFEAIGRELGVSKETIRKKVQAANINAKLIGSIPDCEGIPSRFYGTLAKIERSLVKNNIDLDDYLQNAEESFNTTEEDIDLVQNAMLDNFLTVLDRMLSKPKKKEPRIESLAEFDSRNKYARINVSPDGRKAKFEFAFLTKDELSDIEAYVRNRLSRK
ncbi:hypothetical protein NB663_09240 [Vibrio parahaemolyticus]|uniref:ParB family protein n=1 Tax=Vibrio parahaemolyticus TaxID=670 RepID=UPI00215BE170|nr:ParB family protein [Vibrio parahaemolyticus]EHR5321661.1 hypothetical protein [Vibrio parahaemolyticus]MCR9780706.1 hypothetical protein [Vibrio parahaemolyticus]